MEGNAMKPLSFLKAYLVFYTFFSVKNIIKNQIITLRLKAHHIFYILYTHFPGTIPYINCNHDHNIVKRQAT